MIVAGLGNYFKNLEEAIEDEGINLMIRLKLQKSDKSVKISAAEPEKDKVIEAESFTHLDYILIDIVIASSGNVLGAMKPIEVEILLTEILELSSKRQITHFHKGFS